MLMPSDSAMRRLSTAARICAPMRVRSKPSQRPTTMRDPDHDEDDAVRTIARHAEIDLTLQSGGRTSGWFSGPSSQCHRGDHHEHEADGEEHLVELGRPVEPGIQQALEEHAHGGGGHESEGKGGHEAEAPCFMASTIA